MANPQDTSFDKSSWLVETIRLTAFPSIDPQSINGDDLWHELTGTEPDSMSRTKTDRIYQGEVDNAGFVLSLDPVRVQMARIPKTDMEDLIELPNLGIQSSATESFTAFVRPWLEKAPPLARLAFGATLIQPVASHEEGYARLNQYLPSLNLGNSASDLTFRINRRRPSTEIDGLAINRLSTWLFVRREVIQLGSQKGRIFSPSASSACRLELDINSVPEYSSPEDSGQLPHDRLPSLWNELVRLGDEIAMNGDIP